MGSKEWEASCLEYTGVVSSRFILGKLCVLKLVSGATGKRWSMRDSGLSVAGLALLVVPCIRAEMVAWL